MKFKHANEHKTIVLLIDDEKNVLEGLNLTLRSKYNVVQAQSVNEARLILKKEPIDIVVCDHMMPGMQGLDFMKEMSISYPDIGRIILTGFISMPLAVRAMNMNVLHQFLQKPVHPVELLTSLNLVRQLLIAKQIDDDIRR